MVLLSHALRARGNAGDPIPNPFGGLRQLGAEIRRSQLSMIAAPPGVGKTAFTMDWMLNLNHGRKPQDHLWVQYFSMDSDRGTVGVRTAASIAGITCVEAEALLKRNDPNLLDLVAKGTRHIDFVFDSGLTTDEIATRLAVYADVHGKWPDIIVIDNLSDVDCEQGDQADIAAWLKTHAGITGAAVILLHHVTGPYADAKEPVPLSGIHGQVNRPQRLILTLSSPEQGMLRVSVVKNSNGPADKSGWTFTNIPVDLSRMEFHHG